VTAAQAANILYSGATATTLVVSSASSGAKQSIVSFTVVDGSNAGMANQSVTIGLNAQAISAGVKFSVSGVLSAANQVVNTDVNGVATVTIQSSTFPTPVSVTASLTATPAMAASSTGLVVTAGMPSQDRTTVSVGQLNIEGWRVDGVTTSVTLRTSDRQGNPVPTGTAVNFIASHGSIGGSCLTDATSACSVTYTTSGTRPADGVVSILAYLNGEESFTDLNGNNVWDAGETFFDMGQPFRDDNHNGVYDAGEQVVGTTIPGATSACPGTAYPSVTNTCDGTWTPSILARSWNRIGLSSDKASITQVAANPGISMTVRIADAVNSATVGMATGSSVTAVASSAAATCAVLSVSPPVVSQAVAPTNFVVSLNNIGCGGGGANVTTVTVTVTTPAGSTSSQPFTIP
jgi:hypothetical protein